MGISVNHTKLNSLKEGITLQRKKQVIFYILTSKT